MPAIQSLKKQLRGIRSTRKLTKAMKTVSTVKFSKLNERFDAYAVFADSCDEVLKICGSSQPQLIAPADPSAPAVAVVMASNKGLCGNFNSAVLSFAADKISKLTDPMIVACGIKASKFLKSRGYAVEKDVVFSDVPTFEEASALIDELVEWRKSGRASDVYVIYPRYVNMMLQIPAISELFSVNDEERDVSCLCFPDKRTVSENIIDTVQRSSFYRLVLETAIGAQAATLMTMRSAFDTATELADELELKINRIRQSAVTADVIETAVERKQH